MVNMKLPAYERQLATSASHGTDSPPPPGLDNCKMLDDGVPKRIWGNTHWISNCRAKNERLHEVRYKTRHVAVGFHNCTTTYAPNRIIWKVTLQ